MSTGPGVFRVFSVVTAIFGIGVVAVSGALLHQAIKYRDYYFYGSNYGSGYYGGGGSSGYFGGGSQYYGGAGFGYGAGAGAGAGGIGYGDGDYGAYDPYRYHKVIAIAAVALGVGLIQFFVALILCCANDKNAKPVAIGYTAGNIFILLILVICFGLGFQYRIIYPFYFYNTYRAYYYTEYNPEGQAFAAILGIDIIYLIISLIVVAIFAKRAGFDEPIEWQVRPATSSTAPVHDYGRDGMRNA